MNELNSQIDLSQIVKEALEGPYESFFKVVHEATQLLRSENGKIGNLRVTGRLARIKPIGEAVVIGDLHGDLESLIHILQESNILQRMSHTSGAFLIFLGDYGDRGAYSAEVYFTVLKLKLHYPRQIVLMRGNHEGPEDLLPSPHDLPIQLRSRFGEKWTEAYCKVRVSFEQLYNALLVEGRYLMVHAGLPLQESTIEDLAFAHTTHPTKSFLEDLLWSDPDETIEVASVSPRGAGKLFGRKITGEALKKFGVKILIRGHEPCEDGFKINHDGKILTLFSRKDAPYLNSHGAYLDVSLSEKVESAEGLIPYIHKF